MKLDNIIFTILGCLFVSFIVSAIIFGVISSKDYKKDSNKVLIISTVVIAFLLLGLDFLYNSKISEPEILNIELEELKEENSKLEEENGDLQVQLDDLQKEYENSQELNDLLTEQLESYGIEPYNL